MSVFTLFDFSAELEQNTEDVELLGKHVNGMIDTVTIDSDKICMWVKEECAGEIRSIEVVKDSGQFTEICEHHLHVHEEIMLCHQNGFDINEIVEWTHEERRCVIKSLSH